MTILTQITEWPHVSIVDPRTGENMVTWSQMAAAIKASLADTLKEDEDSGSDLETFSDEDSNPTSDIRSPMKNGAGSKNGGVGVKNKTKGDEKHKNGLNGTNSEEAFKGEKEKGAEAEESWRTHLGEEGSETTNILIRWPDGDREGWTQAATSKLAALLLYIEEKGYSVESHEVVTNFPRRVLHSLDSKATLKELGLFPRETVFVHLKDN